MSLSKEQVVGFSFGSTTRTVCFEYLKPDLKEAPGIPFTAVPLPCYLHKINVFKQSYKVLFLRLRSDCVAVGYKTFHILSEDYVTRLLCPDKLFEM